MSTLNAARERLTPNHNLHEDSMDATRREMRRQLDTPDVPDLTF